MSSVNKFPWVMYTTFHESWDNIPWTVAMRWLQWVGSIKLQVSFAKEPYKRDHILQKSSRLLSILLTVATPPRTWLMKCCLHDSWNIVHRTHGNCSQNSWNTSHSPCIKESCFTGVFKRILWLMFHESCPKCKRVLTHVWTDDVNVEVEVPWPMFHESCEWWLMWHDMVRLTHVPSHVFRDVSRLMWPMFHESRQLWLLFHD